MNQLDPLDLTVTDRLAAVARRDDDGVCPTGTAEVKAHYTGARPASIEWLRADPMIHVARDVLREPGAIAHLSTRYQLVEPCPKARGAWHARRRPEVDEHGHIAGQSTVTLGDRIEKGDPE